MICTQAQVLLAAYREQHDGDIDTTELDAHLEQCPACREVLARSRIVGQRIRALPALEPPPELRSHLMEALAVEHTKYMRQSPVAPVPPAFLRPYLQNHVRSSQKQIPLAAFSTAETGPLPVLPPAKKVRSRAAMGQFAILGIAAVFFMALMMGGITSLLLLAQNHVAPVPSSASVVHPTDVVTAAYAATTPYNHVVNAVADGSAIYYSAYNDGKNGGWMIERLDRTGQTNIPLLAAPSQSPLIVLGATKDWLIWLQFDPPKAAARGSSPLSRHIVRSWSLHYLSLASFQAGNGASVQALQPFALLSGVFDENTAPNWIYSPIQGIWFIQNTLLVAAVDNNGISHLTTYLLDMTARGAGSSTSIASAQSGFVITSPTANSNGSQIFWAQEWQTNDGVLHSNVWMQQTISGPRPPRGRAIQQTSVFEEPFLEDGMSFHPVIADETLFLLSTASAQILQGTQQTPNTTAAASPTGTLQASPTPNTAMSATPWADIGVYPSALDSDIRGTILMYPLDDPSVTTPTPISPINAAASLQAGNDFVLWQTDSGYGMFDAITKTPVTLGEVLNDAQFLSVNDNTTVWMVSAGQTGTANSLLPVTLKVFNWPR